MPSRLAKVGLSKTPHSPSALAIAVGDNLRLDVETARLFRLLGDARVLPLLLKGPALSQWLYQPGDRSYGDIDLLVDPAQVEAVGAFLRARGYERRVDQPALSPGGVDRPPYAFSWRHDRGFLVEVHQTLVGIRVPPEHAWRILSREPGLLDLRREKVPTLRTPARALHLALHAAQHGPGVEKSLEDLRRGLAKEGKAVWGEAYQLAVELEAVEAFTNGLALVPAGKAMLKALGISLEPSLDVELHAAQARSSARSIEWFRRLPMTSKGRWILRKTLPSPGFMRLWHPLARRSRSGLALAYLWRPLWLAKELILGLNERRRVRRVLERKHRDL